MKNLFKQMLKKLKSQNNSKIYLSREEAGQLLYRTLKDKFPKGDSIDWIRAAGDIFYQDPNSNDLLLGRKAEILKSAVEYPKAYSDCCIIWEYLGLTKVILFKKPDGI